MLSKIKLKQSQIRAFTMLESLLVLGLVSLLALSLSSSVQSTFAAVEEQIFFMEFEEFYRETQQLSLAGQKKISLDFHDRSISNGYQKLAIPNSIQLQSHQSITFDKVGGSSYLVSIRFQTRKEVVRYRLNIGNGKIKRIQEAKN